MKVFITGLAGMLGCNIAYKLRKEYIISGVDLIKVNMENVDSYEFDALDYKKLSDCFKEVNPDIIIHTAAAVNVDKCETELDYAEKLNVKMTDNICRAAREVGAKIIYISTDAVFDGTDENLYYENDKVCPINIYSEKQNLKVKKL